MHRRERASAGVAALVAVGAALLLLDAPPVILPQIAVLYATAGYYAARYPDVLRGGSDSPSPDWTAGALGGGLTFSLVGLTTANAPPWLYVYGFGLAAFGFAVGVAYSRDRTEQT